MLNSKIISQRVNCLKNSNIFADVDNATLEVIAGEMEEIEVSQGQVLFEKGDPADKMFVIIEGSYKVHDKENVLNIMKDKGIFGEYALIDMSNRSASLTCMCQGRLLALSSESFYKMLKNNISISLSIMKSLVFRITSEKDKSEKLLQNILPYEVAEELKAKGKVDVQRFDFASVLFTDFSGFTKISEKTPADELINELNHCFTNFDKIISKYNIEKIKTIGDSYMCAGGIPVVNNTNPVDIVLAAMEIRDFMNNRYAEKFYKGKDYWQCRIGINTGSLIAGIVGVKKFAYDIWGDTVNTASRMESCGAVGRINVSESTYQYIKEYFDCEYRGSIEAKGKGQINMYFVNDIKPGFKISDGTIENVK